VTEDVLRGMFGACGDVASVRFAMDESGAFKGFGHLEFVDGASTEEAVKLAGTMIGGRPIRVDYAPPRNRDSSGGRGGGGGRTPGRGGRDGGRGRGRGRDGPSTGNKNKGTIASASGNKKVKFGEED